MNPLDSTSCLRIELAQKGKGDSEETFSGLSLIEEPEEEEEDEDDELDLWGSFSVRYTSAETTFLRSSGFPVETIPVSC